MNNTTKGIRELQRLNTKEREVVYNMFIERGTSEKAINELKALVSLADLLRK